jgi:hypothetical protein
MLESALRYGLEFALPELGEWKFCYDWCLIFRAF